MNTAEKFILDPFPPTHFARRGARWLTLVGGAEVIIGTLAIIYPLAAGVVTATVLGFFLLLAGIMQLARGLQFHGWQEGAMSISAAVLATTCGLLFLLNPLAGLTTISLFLAAYFVASGTLRLVHAFRLRTVLGSWGWLLIDGIITVALGAIILADWPLSSAWILGTLVGIDVLISGIAAVAIGSAIRRVSE